jgi:hypothetical protein
MDDQYKKKYLKYKLKYNELKKQLGGFALKKSNQIFKDIYDFNISKTRILYDLNPILNNDIRQNKFIYTNKKQKIIKYSYLPLFVLCNAFIRINNSIFAKTLRNINKVYIIDLLNCAAIKYSPSTFSWDDIVKKYITDIVNHCEYSLDNGYTNLYIICGKNFASHASTPAGPIEPKMRAYINSLVSTNAKKNNITELITTVAVKSKNVLGLDSTRADDDLMFWSFACAFSDLLDLSTENIDINNAGTFNSSNRLVLMTNDKQKLYDEKILTNNYKKTKILKNLYLDMTSIDDIFEVIMNGTSNPYMLEMIQFIRYYIIEPPSNPDNDASNLNKSKYSLDVYGTKLSKDCTNNELNGTKLDPTQPNRINDIKTIVNASPNCVNNFERFLSLIKYLQYIYFPECHDGAYNICSMVKPKITNFYINKKTIPSL